MKDLNADSPEFLLGQVIRLHHYRMHMLLSELGLYPGQPPILFMLWHQDGRSQKELAEKIGLKPATITVTLKRMEKAGLIERRTDSEDLRVTRVYLTEKAQKLQPQVKQIFIKLSNECFRGFTDEEKVIMRRLLMHVRDNLSKVSKACAL